MAKTDVFVDRVVNIAVTGGLVRFDLGVLDALPRSKDDQGTLEITHRLIMPLESFLGAMRIQEAIIKKMVEDGVLKPQDAAPGTAKDVN